MDSTDAIIQAYYASFNERRLGDLEMLFTNDAVLEQVPSRRQEPARTARIAMARAWQVAFPDAIYTVEQVTPKPPFFEVSLLATGTHQGALDLGGWVFPPTGAVARLRLRELLQIRDG